MDNDGGECDDDDYHDSNGDRDGEGDSNND
jgi:hypothetical protein